MGQEVVAVTQSPAPAALVRAAPSTTSLAPGFRFHPTDEELVMYYLRRKACGKPFRFHAVTEIDVYKSEPWELQDFSKLKTRDQEWYFFSPVDRKYGNGSRLNRATGKGYWKATGKDRPVRHKSQMIGMKKTLVFHSGRAPDGKRTNWVMHEYRLADEELVKAGIAQDAFVLCRIFQKSGLGPPTGDRYAPFVDEEWDNDAALLIPGGEAEDEMANVDDVRVLGNDVNQNGNLNKMDPPQSEIHLESHTLPFPCKRETSEDPEPILVDSKRSKHDDATCGRANANGSEDSSQDPTATATTHFSSVLLEFPLLESIENKANRLASPSAFDASNLEKSVPPGYLKFIGNLEEEILHVSMERDRLKIDVMRAQAMIDVLQSRIEHLTKENNELNRLV